MENKDFKNIFRQELKDHKVSIDKDALWEGIQGKQKKKRVGFFFWFGIGSMAIVLGLGLWSISGGFSSDINNSKTGPSDRKVEKSVIAEKAVEINVTPNEEVVQSNILPVSLKNNEADFVSKNENVKIEDKAISHEQGVIGNQVENVATPPRRSVVKTIAQNENNRIAQKSNDFIVKNEIVLVEEVSPTTVKEIETEFGSDKGAETDIEEITTAIISDQINTSTSQSEVKQEGITIAEALDNNTETDNNKIPDDSDEDNGAGITIDSPKKSFRFEVISQFEYGIPIKTLAAKNEIENDLSVLRNQVETPLENWSVGLVLQANHKSGLFLSGGFRFDQLQEKVEFTEVIQDPILLNDIPVKEVFFANGSTAIINGNAVGTELTTTDYSVYNTYRRFSVPLSIGYEKNWKNWAIDGGINFIFNVRHTFKGFVLDLDNEDDNFILVEDADIFKNRLDMDTRLNFGVTYKFSKFKIRLSPFVQLNESQILNDDSELSQTYRYYGVSLGLRL